jgi:hypothetical protein
MSYKLINHFEKQFDLTYQKLPKEKMIHFDMVVQLVRFQRKEIELNKKKAIRIKMFISALCAVSEILETI